MIDKAARWQELSGSRSNKVWKVPQNNVADLCVKLYPKTKWKNPFSPNYTEAEFSCLTAFQSENLCPKPIELTDSPVGSEQIKAQGHKILNSCPTRRTKELTNLQPNHYVQANGSLSMIHADAVPAGIILSNGMAKLIDWKCPAIGSRKEDLCHFLPPAMHLLYRGYSLADSDQQAFLNSYHGFNPNSDRLFLNAILPWYTWSMAFYCLWQIGRGQSSYQKALRLEL